MEPFQAFLKKAERHRGLLRGFRFDPKGCAFGPVCAGLRAEGCGRPL